MADRFRGEYKKRFLCDWVSRSKQKCVGKGGKLAVKSPWSAGRSCMRWKVCNTLPWSLSTFDDRRQGLDGCFSTFLKPPLLTSSAPFAAAIHFYRCITPTRHVVVGECVEIHWLKDYFLIYYFFYKVTEKYTYNKNLGWKCSSNTRTYPILLEGQHRCAVNGAIHE